MDNTPMTTTKEELDLLLARIEELPADAEKERLDLWHRVDRLRAILNPPQDRRSVTAREHVRTLTRENKIEFLARERYRAMIRERNAGA